MTSYEPVNGIGRRQSFVALALRRYRQDPTFRGLVEFAVIGGVFLALLQLFSSGDPTGLSHLTSPSTKTELHEPPQAPANPPAHVSTPAAPGRSAMPASLGDLLAHAADGLFPRLPRADDLQIDASLFASSPTATQAVLIAAAKSYKTDPRRAQHRLDPLDPTDPNVMFLRGLALIAEPGGGNAASGIALLEKAAAAGQRQSAGYLGLLLVSGPGFQHDTDRGWRLLQKAADAGDAAVARVLGIAYYTGSLGIADPKRAVDYLRIAADRGDGAALLRLAYLAYSGIGMAKDEAEGERLLNRAGEAGNVDAQMTLGQFYYLQYVSGWVNDGALIVRWLGAASDAGDPLAKFRLGEFYLSARAPWRDPAKGAALFHACAAMRNDACLFGYAAVLQRGDGGERDLVKAVALYRLVRGESALKAKQRIDELEAGMSPDEKATALALTSADQTGFPAILHQIAVRDANGCIILGMITICPVDPDPRIPTFEAKVKASGQ